MVMDDEDESVTRQMEWRPNSKGEPYVQYKNPDSPTAYTSITLKAFLLGVRVGAGYAVKNLNGNPLDCRRSNLKQVTLKEARALDIRNRGPRIRKPKVMKKDIRKILGMRRTPEKGR